MNVIQSLASDVLARRKSKCMAAMVLSGLSGITHSKSVAFINSEVTTQVNVRMQRDLRLSIEAFDDALYEKQYRAGVML